MDRLRKLAMDRSAKLSSNVKLGQALEMMRMGLQMKRTTLRRQHPEASEDERKALYLRWLLDGD